MQFYKAVFSRVDGPLLRKKDGPDYYWGRALGLIDFDLEAYRSLGRVIPTFVAGSDQYDVYHLNYPKGPLGYVSTLRVLETFHKLGIGNLHITPLDYKSDLMQFDTPPFRIDPQAKKWPPGHWYPEGFVPHPNNLVQDKGSSSDQASEIALTRPEDDRASIDAQLVRTHWYKPQPIDARPVDLTEPDD